MFCMWMYSNVTIPVLFTMLFTVMEKSVITTSNVLPSPVWHVIRSMTWRKERRAHGCYISVRIPMGKLKRSRWSLNRNPARNCLCLKRISARSPLRDVARWEISWQRRMCIRSAWNRRVVLRWEDARFGSTGMCCAWTMTVAVTNWANSRAMTWSW